MSIIMGCILLVFIVTFFWVKWGSGSNGTETWLFCATVAAMCALILGTGAGAVATAGARTNFEEEVEVRYTIYEGPSGRYVEAGTSGEYNDQITMWYWKDGNSLRKAWKSADSVGINYIEEDRMAYALMTCPSGETLPEWLKMPWEKDPNHDWDADCSYEFINLYIPEGES